MITAIILARNEQEHLYDTVRNIMRGAEQAGFKENQYEIIIVNDGSTDGSAELIKKIEKRHSMVRSIHNQINQGIGASFLLAVQQARYSRVTFFAGDNNAHADLAEQLFKNYDKADVVLSYFINTESRNRFRNVLSNIYTLIYAVTFAIPIRYINGNSVMSVQDIKDLNLKSYSYSIFAEVHVKILRQGKTFYEVAAYSNPDATRSQALSWRTLVAVAGMFLRILTEVFITKKGIYSKKPTRAHVPSPMSHVVEP